MQRIEVQPHNSLLHQYQPPHPSSNEVELGCWLHCRPQGFEVLVSEGVREYELNYLDITTLYVARLVKI